ncbi:Malate/lactate/ureidoglycolate dehydrogenase, LDH2 family [Nonomuraea solani]|uniref:Malate/lactate/ureidoglycolate dehydrogenase, LDH2 family n=1 Tax=Nonomuraea solani TaxID=1144553 RepID=A0A1H6DZU6_9ACTN|nr:Ldh family oxidoreductase [Nonomuraea solani]SEG90868.1 Malate/lactate/ureidoglycolate dehydrogenase, LDH2 family [Nonomuraea solani]
MNASSRLLTAGHLRDLARALLSAARVPPGTAAAVAESLVEADLAGHGSHGVRRIGPYLDRIEAGAIVPDALPEVVSRRGASAVVSGRRGFGQPAARLAAAEAATLAAAHGVGVVAIRECNHVGRLGEYAGTLAGSGLIAQIVGNADPTVAPYGGHRRMLGTNPMAWAVPRAGGAAVVMDWATAAMAEGKLGLLRAAGSPAPEGVLVDPEGRASTDPADFYRGGALLPFGGHKGYGLSVLIELVGGLLTGTGTACSPDYDGTFGTVITAVDITAFVPMESYVAQVESFCAALRASGPGVVVPGEPEAAARAARLKEGIPLPAPVWEELGVLASRLGVPWPDTPPGRSDVRHL